MLYVFIFGRNPVLSFGELISYLKKKDIKAELVDFNEFGAIFDTEINKKWVDELGGIIKIGRVDFIFDDLKRVNEKQLRILDYLPEKFAYGVNIYGHIDYEYAGDLLKDYFKKLRFKAFEIKEEISDSCVQTLPSDIIRKKLVENETDFIFFKAEKGYFARSVSVSDVSAIEKRDLERPARNPLESISIRLAKILVNLSQVSNGILLDPFCGIGTILHEAYLQGIDFRGIDINEDRVKDAIKNMKSFNADLSGKIRKGNATSLEDYYNPGSIDGIATEPYLGPLIKNFLSPQEAVARMTELKELYRKFLHGAAIVLKKGGIIALIVPYFKTRKGNIHLDIKEILPFSLEIHNPLDDIIEKGFPVEYEERKIGRLVYIIKKI